MLLLTHRTSLVHFCHNVWCDAVSNPQNISRTLLSHCVMWCRLLTHWTSLVHFCHTVMWCCCWPTEHLLYTFVTLWCDAVNEQQNISHIILSHSVMWCCCWPTERLSYTFVTLWCDAVADPQNISRTLLLHCVMWCRYDPQNISHTLLLHCVMWCRCWPTERLSYTFVTLWCGSVNCITSYTV